MTPTEFSTIAPQWIEAIGAIVTPAFTLATIIYVKYLSVKLSAAKEVSDIHGKQIHEIALNTPAPTGSVVNPPLPVGPPTPPTL